MDLLSPYEQSVTMSGCIYAIAALGLYVTIASGQFSIMHAAIMGLGGYAAAVTSVEFGASFWAAVFAGAGAGFVIGWLMALILRRMHGMLLAVATLAIGVAVSLIVANIEYLGGSTGYQGIPLRASFWNVVGILGVLFVGVLLLLRRTTFGLALVASGRDETVSSSLGVSTMRVRVFGFAVGGALAGVAGALLVQFLGVINPTDLGFAAEAQLFVYVIIGGVTTPWGALLGAVGVVWGLELLRFSQADRFWILGLLLAVVVLIRPEGILVRRSVRAPGGFDPDAPRMIPGVSAFAYARGAFARRTATEREDSSQGGPI